MPKASCAICHKSWSREDIKLFHVPKNLQKRKKWNDACGINFSDSARICENHFWENDFTTSPKEYPKRRRLKPKVIPTLCLPIVQKNVKEPIKNLNTYDEQILTKCEDIDCVSASKSLGEDLKGAVLKEPLNFINEKLFDENHHSLKVDIRSKEGVEYFDKYLDVENATLETNYDIKIYNSIGVQTGSMDKKICGFIETSMDNQRFSVNCFYCVEMFPVWEWEKFIKHIQSNHRIEHDKKLSNEDVEMTDIVIKPFSIQSDFEYIKTCSNIGDNDENDGDCRNDAIKEFEISFESTNTWIVLDFLKLFRSFPVLWQLNVKPSEEFQNALSKITNEINGKWNINITENGTNNSLKYIKDWFYNIWNQTDNNGIGIECYYIDYLKKCSEFLPLPLHRKSSKRNPSINACEHCSRFFLTQIHLKLHRLNVHNINEILFKCSYCERVFDRSERVKRHESNHIKIRNIFCNICERGFYNERSLKSHVLIHTDDYQHVCEMCGKKFLTPSRYRIHRILHDPPSFKCHICSRSYYRRNLFNEHMKAHRNQRDHICELCGKSFVRRKNLMEHKKALHSNDKPYSCKICAIRFKAFSNLYLHRKKYHLVLEGTNEELEYNFNKGYSRPKYIVDKSTNIRRIKCGICGKSYSFHTGLYAHISKIHGHISKKKCQTHLDDGNAITIIDEQNGDKDNILENKYLVNDDGLTDFSDNITYNIS